MIPQQQICQQCGAKVDPGVSEGVCPACALRDALLSTDDPGDGLASHSQLETIHYFGDYELLAEVGRGGMGVVYRARQTTLNRTVAIKMILTGRLASEEDLKRFRREAQAAANLQHPNIVTVHEVGEHQGQHYYSMDLVDGRSLSELVRERPLPAKQAARYVKIVADAVHYAHQHGTIHRDLKPTNILIDSRDQPRITDFGLARCSAHENSGTHLTVAGQPIGTPAFMSPEQAEGNTGAIGPASDLFSLGAILYYLLTQRPPFTADSFSALLQQVIHDEPISPRALNPSIPRDLETICLKSLQKDPVRRFCSADALSNDLNRFCEGKPILSRRPNMAERAGRWCARNKTVASSLTAIMVVLAAGAGVSAWQATRAKTEAAKSRQIAQFLQDMLHAAGPSVANGRDTTLLVEILDTTATRIGKELDKQPDVRADLQTIIGNVYNELGYFNKAEAMHRDVLATVTKLHGNEHADVASALFNLGAALQGESKLIEAEQVERRALAMRRKLFGNKNADVATSLEDLAAALGLQGKLTEAESALREAVAIQKKVLGDKSADVADSIQNLGQTLRVEGNLADAERMEREALTIRRGLFGNEHLDVAASLNGLGIVLEEQGKFDEGQSAYRDALSIRKKLLGEKHRSVAQTLNNLAILYNDQGKMTEAEAAHREALSIEKEVFGPQHPEVANSLNNLSFVLRDTGKLAEAEATEREALALWKTNFGDEHFQVATALNNLGVILYREQKMSEAEVAHRQSLTMRRKILGDKHPAVAASLEHLAEVLQTTGRLDEAESCLRECLQIREEVIPGEWPAFSVRCSLGDILLIKKEYSKAEPLLISGQEGLEQRKGKIPASNRKCLEDAIKALIRLYENTGVEEKATDWKQKLGRLELPDPDHSRK